MTWRSALVALALVSVVAGAAPHASAAPSPGLFMVADSVVLSAKDAIPGAFPGWNVTITGRPAVFTDVAVTDYVAPSFNGVVAPAGTPAAAIARLNEAINEILKRPDVKAEIETLGGQINVGTPADFAAFIATEAKRWLDVADANNIKVD